MWLEPIIITFNSTHLHLKEQGLIAGAIETGDLAILLVNIRDKQVGDASRTVAIFLEEVQTSNNKGKAAHTS